MHFADLRRRFPFLKEFVQISNNSTGVLRFSAFFYDLLSKRCCIYRCAAGVGRSWHNPLALPAAIAAASQGSSV